MLVELVFARPNVADTLCERLGRQRRLVVLAAQLLDRHVTGREQDLGARDHAGRAVLVPDPDVLEREADERIRRLRRVGALELVAEVRRVRRQHAVPEQRKDRLVLLLQR